MFLSTHTDSDSGVDTCSSLGGASREPRLTTDDDDDDEDDEDDNEANLSLECALQRLAEATLSETEDSFSAPNVIESLKRLEREEEDDAANRKPKSSNKKRPLKGKQSRKAQPQSSKEDQLELPSLSNVIEGKFTCMRSLIVPIAGTRKIRAKLKK